MVLSLVVVDFVDRNGGVDDGGLDGLLLYDWLDGFVDVWWELFVCSMIRIDDWRTYGDGCAHQ